MSIVKLEYSDLKDQNKDLLVKIIYNNFLYLEPEPKLNHNPEAITEILNNKGVVLFLFMHQGKIGSYLLGQIIILEDGFMVVSFCRECRNVLVVVGMPMIDAKRCST